MFRVKLNNRAKKELRRLDKRYFSKVSTFIDLLKENPFVGERMAGEFQGSFRIKTPPLRIIYTPDFKNKIIWIKAIGFRGGVYNSNSRKLHAKLGDELNTVRTFSLGVKPRAKRGENVIKNMVDNNSGTKIPKLLKLNQVYKKEDILRVVKLGQGWG